MQYLCWNLFIFVFPVGNFFERINTAIENVYDKIYDTSFLPPNRF